MGKTIPEKKQMPAFPFTGIDRVLAALRGLVTDRFPAMASHR